MNYSPEEINKFNALAHDWWDAQGSNRALHLVQEVRLGFILKILQSAIHRQPALRILDVGCGGGLLSESLALAGAEVLGIDLAHEMIVVAKEHAQATQRQTQTPLLIHYAQKALHEEVEAIHHKAQQPFDVITCMEMLEHVPQPQDIVQQAAQACATDGWCFFSTIDRSVKSYLTTIVAAEYVLGWVKKGTHHYEQFIRPAQLVRWCEDSGLSVKHIVGLKYDVISQSFSLSPSKMQPNYIVAAKKTNG